MANLPQIQPNTANLPQIQSNTANWPQYRLIASIPANWPQYRAYWPCTGHTGLYTGNTGPVPVILACIPVILACTGHTGLYPYPYRYPYPTHTPTPLPPMSIAPTARCTSGCMLIVSLQQSRRTQVVHQASFVLETKGHIDITVSIFSTGAKSDISRGALHPDFSKSAVFGMFLAVLCNFDCFWPILAQH